MDKKTEVQLLADLQTIKENVLDMREQVRKNTRFRLYITGFLCISMAIWGALFQKFDLMDLDVQAKEKPLKKP